MTLSVSYYRRGHWTLLTKPSRCHSLDIKKSDDLEAQELGAVWRAIVAERKDTLLKHIGPRQDQIYTKNMRHYGGWVHHPDVPEFSDGEFSSDFGGRRVLLSTEYTVPWEFPTSMQKFAPKFRNYTMFSLGAEDVIILEKFIKQRQRRQPFHGKFDKHLSPQEFMEANVKDMNDSEMEATDVETFPDPRKSTDDTAEIKSSYDEREQGRPMIFSCKARYDWNNAPCVENDLLSLAICQTKLRRQARIFEGDYVLIFLAEAALRNHTDRKKAINLGHKGKDKPLLLYAFKVTKICDFVTYQNWRPLSPATLTLQTPEDDEDVLMGDERCGNLQCMHRDDGALFFRLKRLRPCPLCVLGKVEAVVETLPTSAVSFDEATAKRKRRKKDAVLSLTSADQERLWKFMKSLSILL